MSGHETPALPGRQPFLLELVEFGLGVFSLLILVSFGGQVMVAPVLLPVQWLIARHTSGWTSMAFSVLGVLLTVEVIWLGWILAVGDGTAALVGGSFVAIGSGVVFFRISRPMS